MKKSRVKQVKNSKLVKKSKANKKGHCEKCQYPYHKINLAHCPLCKDCIKCSKVIRECVCSRCE